MKMFLASFVAMVWCSAALAGTATIEPVPSDGGSIDPALILLLLIGTVLFVNNSAPRQSNKTPQAEADDDIIMKF